VEWMIRMAKKRGNNEGSIYRRENGTWAAQYTVWTAEGRKRRSLSTLPPMRWKQRYRKSNFARVAARLQQ
jgi:hypothetical protein